MIDDSSCPSGGQRVASVLGRGCCILGLLDYWDYGL